MTNLSIFQKHMLYQNNRIYPKIKFKLKTEGLLFWVKSCHANWEGQGIMDLGKPYIEWKELCSENRKRIFENSIWKHSIEMQTKLKNEKSYFLKSWTDDEIFYFISYAVWNYLSFPIFFMNAEIKKKWTSESRVELEFDETIPTHCKKQTFQFTEDGKLLNHYYTANIVSPFATAKNRILEYQNINDFYYTSKRAVSPIIFGIYIPFLDLVKIQIRVMDIGV